MFGASEEWVARAKGAGLRESYKKDAPFSRSPLFALAQAMEELYDETAAFTGLSDEAVVAAVSKAGSPSPSRAARHNHRLHPPSRATEA